MKAKRLHMHHERQPTFGPVPPSFEATWFELNPHRKVRR